MSYVGLGGYLDVRGVLNSGPAFQSQLALSALLWERQNQCKLPFPQL